MPAGATDPRRPRVVLVPGSHLGPPRGASRLLRSHLCWGRHRQPLAASQPLLLPGTAGPASPAATEPRAPGGGSRPCAASPESARLPGMPGCCARPPGAQGPGQHPPTEAAAQGLPWRRGRPLQVTRRAGPGGTLRVAEHTTPAPRCAGPEPTAPTSAPVSPAATLKGPPLAIPAPGLPV